MVCPPLCGDNPRALARGLIPVLAVKLRYNYFIPHKFVNTLHITIYEGVNGVYGLANNGPKI